MGHLKIGFSKWEYVLFGLGQMICGGGGGGGVVADMLRLFLHFFLFRSYISGFYITGDFWLSGSLEDWSGCDC